ARGVSGNGVVTGADVDVLDVIGNGPAANGTEAPDLTVRRRRGVHVDDEREVAGEVNASGPGVRVSLHPSVRPEVPTHDGTLELTGTAGRNQRVRIVDLRLNLHR